MKFPKKLMVLGALTLSLTLVATGCGNGGTSSGSQQPTTPQGGTSTSASVSTPSSSTGSTSTPSSSSSSASSASSSSSATSSQPTEKVDISVEDAQSLVTEKLDANKYTVEKNESEPAIDGRNFYVFNVLNKEDGSLIGKVAIDRESGERYTYTDEGTLQDYSTFPLYNPSADAQFDWNGTYLAEDGRTLEINQGDQTSFEYSFSKGADASGIGRIIGDVATDENAGINFSYLEGGIINVTGAATEYVGTYTLKK